MMDDNTVTDGATPVEEQGPAPDVPEIVVTDARDGYASYEVPALPGGEPETEHGETPPSEAPTDAASETAPPEDSAPPSGQPETEPGEEPTTPEPDSPRVDLNDPAVQQEIDRRAANLAGNRLQKLRQEEQRWAEADEFYRRLMEDEVFRDEAIEANGGAQALFGPGGWVEQYHSGSRSRERLPSDEQQAIAAQQEQFAGAFNQFAAQAFRDRVARVPGYDQFPDDVKRAIDAVDGSREGWLSEGLEAVVRGMESRIERMERAHQQQLKESREAGANEARAAREEGRPLVTAGQNGARLPLNEARARYARGDMGLEEWQGYKRYYGSDY